MLFKAYNLFIDSDFDLGFPIAKASPPDISFKKHHIGSVKTVKTNIFRMGIQAKVFKDHESVVLEWPKIAKFQINGDENIYYQRFTKDDNIFRLFATSEVLGLILQKKSYFLLHGSAVKINNEAFIFIGVPGAGKSTTIAAFAKAGYTVLSDDMTAISFDESGKATVIPAYPQIKIWEDSVKNLGFDKSKLEPAYEGHNKYLLKQNEEKFPSKSIPLKEIIVLQKPYSKKSNSINAIETPIELLKYFPLPQQTLRGNELRKHFMDSLKIASHVSFRRINRPKGYSQLLKFIEQF
ncbi:MAG: serine kinase [Emticicia sp.]|uniref:serine kinase n=1 Tax=Emticicia sp. TaxID=1930953 RepID=UPI003BA6B40D